MSIDVESSASSFNRGGSTSTLVPPSHERRTALSSASVVFDASVESDHLAVEAEEGAQLPTAAQPSTADKDPSKNPWELGIDWPVAVFMASVHVATIGAAFFFTWKAVALLLFLGWFTGGVGICLGYHRLLTHGSFQTYRPVRWLHRLYRRLVRARLGDHLGGQSSKAPCLQR